MDSNLQKRVYSLLTSRTGDNSGNTTDVEQQENIYDIKDVNSYLSSLSTQAAANGNYEKMNTNIFGMPYHFLESTDMHMDGNNRFGYAFFNHIYMEKPIATLMPGKMVFLPAFSKNKKNIFSSLAADTDNQNSKDALEELISEEAGSRYYDFATDYTAYMNYVNLMCRVCAVYLGLGKENGYTAPDGGSYTTYDWKNYHSIEGYTTPSATSDNNLLSNVKDFFKTVADDLTAGQRCYVNFYIDPNTSVSENLSNTTQNSQLEGLFDTAEGLIKEVQMITNTVGAEGITGFIDTAIGKMEDLANAATLGVFADLLGLGKQVLNGSNLIYPEIWTDSDYSKNFQIQINLASPYGSKEAIYLNILVPMMHALCLGLPRQSTENSFNSPFLIRGYCQGWFSIDMGMVESISIDKGPEQSWTVEGLPTQVKITLNIKELYSSLMMSPSTKPSYFFSNQGLIDYLGVACGVDMTVPHVYFNFRLASALLAGKVMDIPNNMYRTMAQSVQNLLSKKFKF